jgi:hypothetical protein
VSRIRVRRPLLALVALLAALAVGYGVRAARHHDSHPAPSPATSSSLGALGHRPAFAEAD